MVPDTFTGDVILDDQNVAEDALKQFWTGGDRYDGFLTKTPPPGTFHVRAKIYKEFQFVYKGFSTRTVSRTKRVFLINEIKSSEDFTERLAEILQLIS